MTVKMQQRRLKSESHYEVDEAWDEDLHSLLGADWPCSQRQHLDELVAEIATYAVWSSINQPAVYGTSVTQRVRRATWRETNDQDAGGT